MLAAAPSSATDFVLGPVRPLSSPVAGLGRSIQQRTQQCVDWLNRQGDVAGHRLRLDCRDDAGDPLRALALPHSLKAEGSTSLLLGPRAAPQPRLRRPGPSRSVWLFWARTRAKWLPARGLD